MMLTTLPAIVINSGAYGVGCFIATRFSNSQRRSRIVAEWIRAYLIRMGPLYIKVGQVLATRSDMLPGDMQDVLSTLQDDVPGMSNKALQKILHRGFGPDWSETLLDFTADPIASGSIAQVHEARLRTGERVAVKIVKHGVVESLRDNLRIVGFSLRLIHKAVRPARFLDLPERFDEIAKLLSVQVDMDEERRNQQAIYEAFQGHPYIKIPRLYPDLCRDDILVMEFVEGLHIKDISACSLPRQQVARRVQDAIYTMLYHEGICHADPHPGNMFFSKSGDVILVDFGIVAKLNEEEKWALSAYFCACIRQEWEIAVERFTRAFVSKKGNIYSDWESYERSMIDVFKFHYHERTGKWSTYEFFRDCSRVLNHYGAKYSTQFAKIELIFLSCEGTADKIDPHIDIWDNARRFNDRFSPYMSDAVKAIFEAHFKQTTPQSVALAERASKTLVAPTHLDRYFVPSGYPLFVKEAKGSRVVDVDGNSYVDLSAGYGPHVLGYAHPSIVESLEKCVQAGWVNAIGNLPELELAEILLDAFPSAERAVFSNSGTEAVMQAIRICRAHRKRNVIAKFEGHYHGYSDSGMVSSYFRFRGPIEAPEPIHGSPGCHTANIDDVLVLQYAHPKALEELRAKADTLACVICEPMPTVTGGYDTPFLQELRSICDSTGLPLVFDEVVSGFRATYGGVQRLIGVEPDITCLGKIIGGGLPCGAMVGKERLIGYAKTTGDPFTDFEHRVFIGGTMSGNSMSCAAGIGALTYLRDHPEIYDDLDAATAYLADNLRATATEKGVQFQLKAKHSIFGMAFYYKPSKYYRQKMSSNLKANVGLAYYMRKHGVYMPEMHTMMISAAHSRADLDLIADAFSLSLDELIRDGFFVT